MLIKTKIAMLISKCNQSEKLPETRLCQLSIKNTALMEAASSNASAKKKASKKKRRNSKSRKSSQESVFKRLEKKLGMTPKEITTKHKQFMKKHPTGEMTQEDFIENSKLMGGVKRCMAESLFRVFDEDHSGTMDFEEFMMASNCTNMSSPQDKLEWIFKVFDEDGGGSIDIDEVIKLVIGLFNMSGEVEDKEVILACVLDILDIIDVDGDGEITREEFVGNAMKSGFIKNILDETEFKKDESVEPKTQEAEEDSEENLM